MLRAITTSIGRDVWPRISPAVVGPRPGSTIRSVVVNVSTWLSAGSWIARWDIEKAYASVPRERAFELLVDTYACHPALVDLLRGWYKRQGNRFPGLIEGSPAAPVLLANVLQQTIVPELGELAATTAVWLDDGITICNHASDAHGVLGRIRDALGRFGLRLHPEKTGVHRHDVDAGVLAGWQFLGIRWRGGVASLDPATADDIVRNAQVILDTSKDTLRCQRRLREYIAPRFDHYADVLGPDGVRDLRDRLFVTAGYLWEPSSSVESAVSRRSLRPRVGVGYGMVASASHEGHQRSKVQTGSRYLQTTKSGPHPSPWEASGIQVRREAAGSSTSVHDALIEDLGRMARFLLARSQREPVLKSAAVGPAVESLLRAIDRLRMAVARRRWRGDAELVGELDYFVVAGFPEEIGHIVRTLESLRKKTGWRMAGRTLSWMCITYDAFELEDVILAGRPCGSCGSPFLSRETRRRR